MKIRNLTFCAAVVAAAVIVSHVVAQDKAAGGKGKGKGAEGGAPPNMEEMMKKVEEAGKPGAAHKVLDPTVGDWETSARWWMAPDSPPMESKGTSKKQWILDSRFLQEEHKGDMMGKPFQGLGLTGYDNMKKKYVGVWVDSMGTAMAPSEGTADSAGKVITMNGTMDDPMTGEKNKAYKYVLRIAGPDKHIMEMHDLALGEKSKMGEITYTRK
jgi:hypothetical protein